MTHPTNRQPKTVSMEFHVSRRARDYYQFDESLFSLNGNVIFANFHASRMFAQKINQKRDLVSYPENAVQAGQINAMGLIDEISHHMVAIYRQERSPDVMMKAVENFLQKILVVLRAISVLHVSNVEQDCLISVAEMNAKVVEIAITQDYCLVMGAV